MINSYDCTILGGVVFLDNYQLPAVGTPVLATSTSLTMQNF